jgi:hypothetical protein
MMMMDDADDEEAAYKIHFTDDSNAIIHTTCITDRARLARIPLFRTILEQDRTMMSLHVSIAFVSTLYVWQRIWDWTVVEPPSPSTLVWWKHLIHHDVAHLFTREYPVSLNPLFPRHASVLVEDHLERHENPSCALQLWKAANYFGMSDLVTVMSAFFIGKVARAGPPPIDIDRSRLAISLLDKTKHDFFALPTQLVVQVTIDPPLPSSQVLKYNSFGDWLQSIDIAEEERRIPYEYTPIEFIDRELALALRCVNFQTPQGRVDLIHRIVALLSKPLSFDELKIQLGWIQKWMIDHPDLLSDVVCWQLNMFSNSLYVRDTSLRSNVLLLDMFASLWSIGVRVSFVQYMLEQLVHGRFSIAFLVSPRWNLMVWDKTSTPQCISTFVPFDVDVFHWVCSHGHVDARWTRRWIHKAILAPSSDINVVPTLMQRLAAVDSLFAWFEPVEIVTNIALLENDDVFTTIPNRMDVCVSLYLLSRDDVVENEKCMVHLACMLNMYHRRVKDGSEFPLPTNNDEDDDDDDNDDDEKEDKEDANWKHNTIHRLATVFQRFFIRHLLNELVWVDDLLRWLGPTCRWDRQPWFTLDDFQTYVMAGIHNTEEMVSKTFFCYPFGHSSTTRCIRHIYLLWAAMASYQFESQRPHPYPEGHNLTFVYDTTMTFEHVGQDIECQLPVNANCYSTHTTVRGSVRTVEVSFPSQKIQEKFERVIMRSIRRWYDSGTDVATFPVLHRSDEFLAPYLAFRASSDPTSPSTLKGRVLPFLERIEIFQWPQVWMKRELASYLLDADTQQVEAFRKRFGMHG